MLVALAAGGVVVAVGFVGRKYAMGAWPPHDAMAYWMAGRHLLEGGAVYGGGSDWFLAFLYAPPIAVLSAVFGLLPHDLAALALLVASILALRYVTGSWLVTGLLGWMPFLHGELVALNIDCLIAAALYASATDRKDAGVGLAIVAMAKFSPALMLVRAHRRQWVEVAVTVAVLLLVTLPVLGLWPAYVDKLAERGGSMGVPLLLRLPVAGVLLLLRRPWSVAAGAALATPIFYTHSVVLLLPAVRLAWGAWLAQDIAPRPWPSRNERRADRRDDLQRDLGDAHLPAAYVTDDL